MLGAIAHRREILLAFLLAFTTDMMDVDWLTMFERPVEIAVSRRTLHASVTVVAWVEWQQLIGGLVS